MFTYKNGIKLTCNQFTNQHVMETVDLQVTMYHSDNALIALDEKIQNLRQAQCRLQKMEMTCDDAKEMVIQSAQSLVSAIEDHKRRLLIEIETFRETQYKKCQTDQKSFDAFVQNMEEEREKLSEQYQQNGGDYDIHQLEKCKERLAEGIEKLTKKVESKSISPEMVIEQGVVFNTIRCNTSFGTIDPIDANGNGRRFSRSQSLGQHLSAALIPGKSPDMNRMRSSSVSLNKYPQNGQTNEGRENLTIDRRISMESTSLVVPALKDQRLSSMSLITQVMSEKCLWKISREGSNLGEVNCPNDVIFLDDGSTVISDRDNQRLQVFDSEGSPQKALLTGDIKPRRIALTKDGHIAATDSKLNNIRVIDLRGQILKTWGEKKKSKTNFVCPCGIAVSSKGQFVISDLEKHTLTVLNKDGKSPKMLQSSSSCFEFHSPSYVTYDSNDRILISDSWYQTIYVFDKNGKPAFEVTTTNQDMGTHLKYPNGICVDAQDNIYVAEWGNHTVSKFASDGKFVEHVLTRNDGIFHPAGIAIQNGRLAVTEYSDSHSAVGVYSLDRDESDLES